MSRLEAWLFIAVTTPVVVCCTVYIAKVLWRQRHRNGWATIAKRKREE